MKFPVPGLIVGITHSVSLGRVLFPDGLATPPAARNNPAHAIVSQPCGTPFPAPALA